MWARAISATVMGLLTVFFVVAFMWCFYVALLVQDWYLGVFAAIAGVISGVGFGWLTVAIARGEASL